MRSNWPVFALAAAAAFTVPGQAPVAPMPIVIANDKVELTTLSSGGAFSRFILRDGEPLSPAGARQLPNCFSASANASSGARSPPTIRVALSGRKYRA